MSPSGRTELPKEPRCPGMSRVNGDRTPGGLDGIGGILHPQLDRGQCKCRVRTQRKEGTGFLQGLGRSRKVAVGGFRKAEIIPSPTEIRGQRHGLS